MVKTTGFSRFMMALLTLLMLLGLFVYFVPRLARTANGENVDWTIYFPFDQDILSPYGEQAFLQNQYINSLQQKVSGSLAQLLGKDSVHVNISAQLDLINTKGKDHASGMTLHSVGQDIYAVSAVVLLDSPKDTSKNAIYHPFSKAQLKRYTDIVKTIIGYDSERGDKVLVLNQPFHPSHPAKGIVWVQILGFILFLMVSGFLVALLCASLLPEKQGGVLNQSQIMQVQEICSHFPEQASAVLKRWILKGRVEWACVIVLAVGTQQARVLFRFLKQNEVHQIIRLVRLLGTVPQKAIMRVLNAFVREFNRPTCLMGTDGEIEKLLRDIPDGQNIYAEILATGNYQTLWHRFNATESDTLIRFLKTQSPEMVAFVLFNLSDTISGQILTNLPDEIRKRILIHLKHIRHISHHVISRMTGKIAHDFYKFIQTETAGEKKLNAILKTLSEQDVAHLKEKMVSNDIGAYSWQDVLNLSRAEKIRLLTYLDLDVLALALKEASDKEKQMFSSLLSAEQWQSVLKQCPAQGTVEQARRIMIKTAQELFG